MSFREKSAWITFILLLVVFGFYFVSFGVRFFAQVHGFSLLPGTGAKDNGGLLIITYVLFALLVVVIIVGETVLHIIFALRSRAEANAPQDERERLIVLKATRPAYYVLSVTAFLSIGLLHLGGGAFGLANGILFAMWLGELTNYGAQIYFYRRGA